MPRACSYGLCKNRQGESDCRFFPFPPMRRDPERRKLWAVRCNRKNTDGRTWEPNPNTESVFVCSDHFITGEPWNAKTHPDYAPSVLCRTLDNPETQKATKALQRFKTALNRTLTCNKLPSTVSTIRNVNTLSTPSSGDNSIETLSSPMEITTDGTSSIPYASAGETTSTFRKRSSTVSAIRNVNIDSGDNSIETLSSPMEITTDGTSSIPYASAGETTSTFRKRSSTVSAIRNVNIDSGDNSIETLSSPMEITTDGKSSIPYASAGETTSTFRKRSSTVSAIRNVNIDSGDNSIETLSSPMEITTDGTSSIPNATGGDTPVDFTVTNFPVNSLNLHDCIFSAKSSNITFIVITDDINPRIKMSVVLDVNFKVWVHVFGKLVDEGSYLWKHLPTTFRCLKNVQSLLDVLHSALVCPGIDSPKLISAVKHSRLVVCADEQGRRVRSINCELLISGSTICAKCRQLRKSLSVRHFRSKQQSSLPDLTRSQKPNTSLSSPLKLAKLAQLAHRNKQCQKEIASLKLKLERNRKCCTSLIATQGETLNSVDTEAVMQLANECKNTVLEEFPKGSFQHIFFEQQIKYNNLKEKSGMRWHPAIIRWCLFLRSKSAKAYDGIRSVLSLPSNRTLYDYTHYTEHGIGLNPKTVEQLISAASQLGCYSQPYHSFVGILQDEIKIKSDLVYHKTTGELIGYVNLDNVANEILNFENLKGSSKPLAEHMLVIMVRGITTSLCYPLASYATKVLTCSELYTIMWECIECVEVVVGLRVLYICCDGAIQNRKFFQLHVHGDEEIHKTRNLYASDNREIYFISDPPHLLKTARNCFANSFAHSNTRHMWFNNDISWSHVVRLYDEHCYQSQFRLCPKLTRDHIDLTSFSKMRVSLAAQVLSDTVANALDMVYGDSVQSTVNFIRMINKWFDIVNVKNLYEGRNSRNPNLDPFTDTNDPRLLWMETEFLDYFETWKLAVDARPGTFSPKQKQQMQLSTQTLHGLQITSKSIAAIVRFVLSAGAPFVLTSHFNQDPLEQFFGHCRHKGGSNDNPTVNEACHAINTIRTVNTQAVSSSRGNTKPVPQILDMTPVPKRPSHIRLT